MKIKHLLAAVSLVALTAGTAQAQFIDAGATVPTPQPLALELDAANGTGANFQIHINAGLGNTFPAGTALNLVIELPADSAFSADLVGGTGISAAGGISTISLQNGGMEGGTSVEYLLTLTATPSVIIANLPIKLTDCPTAGNSPRATINVDASDSPVGSGVAVIDPSALVNEFFPACESAINPSFGTDDGTTVTGEGDTLIDLVSGYLQLNNEGGAASTNEVIGVVNFENDTSVSTTLNASTPLQAADIDEITFDVVFQDGDAITNVDLNLFGGGSVAGVPSVDGNTYSFTVNTNTDLADLIDASDDRIFITVDGVTPVTSQAVTLTNPVVSFEATTVGGVALDPTDTSNVPVSGSLDGLEREGQSFGVFDWNGGEAGRTISQFRITGLTPNSTTDFNVRISNSVSSGGADVDGTYPGTVTANENGVATLSSNGYGDAAVPAHKNHDALITIETINDLDMDRLITRNGIVTNFGDGANDGTNANGSTPTGDADQNNPVTGNDSE